MILPAVVLSWVTFPTLGQKKVGNIWENALIFSPMKGFLPKFHSAGSACIIVAFLDIFGCVKLSQFFAPCRTHQFLSRILAGTGMKKKRIIKRKGVWGYFDFGYSLQLASASSRFKFCIDDVHIKRKVCLLAVVVIEPKQTKNNHTRSYAALRKLTLL